MPPKKTSRAPKLSDEDIAASDVKLAFFTHDTLSRPEYKDRIQCPDHPPVVDTFGNKSLPLYVNDGRNPARKVHMVVRCYSTSGMALQKENKADAAAPSGKPKEGDKPKQCTIPVALMYSADMKKVCESIDDIVCSAALRAVDAIWKGQEAEDKPDAKSITKKRFFKSVVSEPKDPAKTAQYGKSVWINTFWGTEYKMRKRNADKTWTTLPVSREDIMEQPGYFELKLTLEGLKIAKTGIPSVTAKLVAATVIYEQEPDETKTAEEDSKPLVSTTVDVPAPRPGSEAAREAAAAMASGAREDEEEEENVDVDGMSPLSRKRHLEQHPEDNQGSAKKAKAA